MLHILTFSELTWTTLFPGANHVLPQTERNSNRSKRHNLGIYCSLLLYWCCKHCFVFQNFMVHSTSMPLVSCSKKRWHIVMHLEFYLDIKYEQAQAIFLMCSLKIMHNFMWLDFASYSTKSLWPRRCLLVTQNICHTSWSTRRDVCMCFNTYLLFCRVCLFFVYLLSLFIYFFIFSLTGLVCCPPQTQVKYTQGGLENLELARKYFAQALRLNNRNMRALFGLYMVSAVLRH